MSVLWRCTIAALASGLIGAAAGAILGYRAGWRR
jgi:hypothetical protein